MQRDKNFIVIFVLVILAATGTLSTDMYLPSLQNISVGLSTTMQMSQVTFSAYLLGLTLMRLVYGPLADRYGKKKMLLHGLTIYTIFSIVCILSINIYILIIARVLQAVGICAVGVISPAIVKELYDENDSAKVISYIVSTIAVTPLIAPFVGSYLQENFGWRANFIVLSILGVFLIIIVKNMLQETSCVSFANNFNIKAIVKTYFKLLKRPIYMYYVVIMALMFGGIFSFVTSSAYFFMQLNHLNLIEFSKFYGFIVLAYIIGNIFTRIFVARFGVRNLVIFGAGSALTSGVTILFGHNNINFVVIPMMIYMFASGIIIPNSIAGAINICSDASGSASGLMGFFQMAIGTLTSLVASLLEKNSVLPMKITIFGVCLGVFVCCMLLYFHTQKELKLSLAAPG